MKQKNISSKGTEIGEMVESRSADGKIIKSRILPNELELNYWHGVG